MNSIVCVTFIVIMAGVASAYIPCSSCDGTYVHSNLGTGCVAAVREKCAGLKSRATGTWTRGLSVKERCTTIPVGSAIATFHGAGQTYNSGSYKHAAIFMGCQGTGFLVHDQWVNNDGSLYGCRARTIPFGSAGVNGGDNFWTID